MSYERTRALLLTREFLRDLVYPSRIPGVLDALRSQVRRLFEHHPELELIDIAAAVVPLWLARMVDVDDGGEEPVHAVNYVNVAARLAAL